MNHGIRGALTVLLVLGSAFILAGCTGVFAKSTTSASSSGGCQTVSPDDAQTLINKGSLTIVDVREQSEYDTGHLKDALLIPVGSVNERAMSELPDKEATILVYCRTGRRSADASAKLVSMGYSHVYNLDGGITAWKGEIVK